jgi:hypothetical protein
MPSVVYGYAQAAAAFVDLDVMETQRARRFVDPVAIAEAVNSALVSLDLPVAGAYACAGIDIATSWRELVAELFASKKVQINRLDETLLELLMLLHGSPGNPAVTLPVHCPTPDCGTNDIAVPAAGRACPGCGSTLFPTDTAAAGIGQRGGPQRGAVRPIALRRRIAGPRRSDDPTVATTATCRPVATALGSQRTGPSAGAQRRTPSPRPSPPDVINRRVRDRTHPGICGQIRPPPRLEIPDMLPAVLP